MSRNDNIDTEDVIASYVHASLGLFSHALAVCALLCFTSPLNMV